MSALLEWTFSPKGPSVYFLRRGSSPVSQTTQNSFQGGVEGPLGVSLAKSKSPPWTEGREIPFAEAEDREYRVKWPGPGRDGELAIRDLLGSVFGDVCEAL